MTYHVILAEDEPDVRDFLVRAVSRVRPQAAISAVANGREAFVRFQQVKADLIISDYRMPEMSGLDLLHQVRAISPVHFVLISADMTVEPLAWKAGVTDFIAKPLSLTHLRNTVERLLP